MSLESCSPWCLGPEMTKVATERHIQISVKCSYCQDKQIIQVLARTGFSAMGYQRVECVACKTSFEVMVPDRIIGGPFPQN